MLALALPATAVAATIRRQRLLLAAWRFGGSSRDEGAGKGPLVEFRILGPLEVVRDGESVVLGAAQQRALLAVLVLHRGEVVSIDRLVDELWGERAPASAAKTVQVYVSQLRKALGAGVIVTQGRGYRLAVEPEQVDVGRFEALRAEGRRALADGDAARAQGAAVLGAGAVAGGAAG